MNKILVPVDFEKQSLIALEQSFNLARRILAEIEILYVYHPSSIFGSIFNDDQKNEMLILIEERLSEMARKASVASGVVVTYRLEKGKIHTKIIEVANEIKAQFIFMGTSSSGHEDKQTKRIGYNTYKVLKAAPCSVLTINCNPAFDGCRHILLPLDLTKESLQKVPFAIEIAKYYEAGIKVVSALLPENTPDDADKLYLAGVAVARMISSAEIDCTFELLRNTGDEEPLVPAILHYARQHGEIDMVIISNKQDAGLVEYFVGSDTHEFIRLSDIPVLAVMYEDSEFESLF